MDVPPPEFCLLAIQHWSTCMTKAEWGSWAQATGTTAAVVVAAMVVRWQLRHSDRRDVDALLGRTLHAMSLVSETQELQARLGDVAEGSIDELARYRSARDQLVLNKLKTSFAALDLKDFVSARECLVEIEVDLNALRVVLDSISSAAAASAASGAPPQIESVKAAYVFGGGFDAINRLKVCEDAMKLDTYRVFRRLAALSS